jgi:hypothetical protein
MFFVPLLLSVAPVTIETVKATPDAQCQPNKPIHAQSVTKSLVHPLGAEPAAQSLYAVVREVDGCNKPIVLSPQVGQPPIR